VNNTTNSALFLDRDGVINIDYGYVFKKEKFDFIDGIFKFVKYFFDKGFEIIIITNQSGIARQYYTESDFQNISKYMSDKFLENGIIISKIYHCSCHPDFSDNCECRKPKPNMILQAKSDFQLDLTSSILVGDSKTDIEAGQKAGIVQNYLFKMDNINFKELLDLIINSRITK